MPWSTGFRLDLLRPTKQIRMIIEDVEDSGFAPGATAIRLSSHREAGYNEVIGQNGARVTPGVVSIGDWRTTVGEMTIGIRPVIDLRTILARGRLVAVKVGIEGYAPADYETVFLGHVQAFDRSGEEWSLTIRSVVASLISRFTETAGETRLFYNIAETTLDVNYVAAGGLGPTSFTVTNGASAIANDLGDYLVQIFPDTGDPFFIDAAAIAGAGPHVFSGSSQSPLFGASAETATAGARVVLCAWVVADPTAAFRRILMSTGVAGANGFWDVLDASWGLGFPQAFVDLDDINTTETLVDGPAVWQVYAAAVEDDALSWLQNAFNPAGLVICERMGMLTLRQVFPSYEGGYDEETITDRDVIAFESQQTWDSSQPIEYAAFGVTEPQSLVIADGSFAPTSTLSEGLDSRPAQGGRIAHLQYVDASSSDWADLVRDRVGPWSTRVPEIVTVLCRGLRLAALAPCDSVIIESRFFSTRDNVASPKLMVLSVEPDWFAGTVRLVLGYTPEDANEF